tara:strand:- start:4537 stop:4764 length:228 start_codon:yes stop_codon:yes gene_type:complete
MSKGFGSRKSLIIWYEEKLQRYLDRGIGESTYIPGPDYNASRYKGIIITENVITATRRRLFQLKAQELKKKKNLK